MSLYCGMYGTAPPKTMAPAAPQETSWCSGTKSQPRPSASIPSARRPRLARARSALSGSWRARCHPHMPPLPWAVLRRGAWRERESGKALGPGLHAQWRAHRRARGRGTTPSSGAPARGGLSVRGGGSVPGEGVAQPGGRRDGRRGEEGTHCPGGPARGGRSAQSGARVHARC